MMNLTDQINNDIKVAMKARDTDSLNSLRAIKSALLLEATKGGNSEMTEEVGIQILQKLQKQRMDAYQIYVDQKRDDLAAEEKMQAEVISRYLPKQMDRDELLPLIEALIVESGAEGPKDMGKVMGLASKKFAGQAPGKLIADLVKEVLNR
jgi:uncharacterized protein YqeY